MKALKKDQKNLLILLVVTLGVGILAVGGVVFLAMDIEVFGVTSKSYILGLGVFQLILLFVAGWYWLPQSSLKQKD